jgi:hypothetical protein
MKNIKMMYSRFYFSKLSDFSKLSKLSKSLYKYSKIRLLTTSPIRRFVLPLSVRIISDINLTLESSVSHLS